MPQEFSSIYRAKNLPEAQLLCNLLEEEGIHATVTNSVLENGSGSEIMGWPTTPRVMVAEEDAVHARKFAEQFDQEISGRSRNVEQISNLSSIDSEVVEEWPCCPECGKRRLTRCKFCGKSGSDFLPADRNTEDLLGLPTSSDDAFSGCTCGPGGCGSHKNECESEGETSSESDTPLLICPTCDEPFHPEYLRRCEWCGHEFADGVETPIEETPVQEPFNWRIAYVSYVLAFLAIAAVVYFLFLF